MFYTDTFNLNQGRIIRVKRIALSAAALLVILFAGIFLAPGCARPSSEVALKKAYQAVVAGNWEKGLEWANDCLRGEQENTKARIIKGLCLHELRHGKRAARVLRKAVRNTPASFFAQYFYGWVLYENGRYGEALKPLRKARDLRKGSVETLVLLAGVALHQDIPQKGLMYLQPLRRYSTFRDHPALYNDLGLMHLQLQHYEKALQNLRKAYEIAPENPVVLQNLAVYWDRYRNNSSKALHYYRLCKSASQQGGHKDRTVKVTQRLRNMLLERKSRE